MRTVAYTYDTDGARVREDVFEIRVCIHVHPRPRRAPGLEFADVGGMSVIITTPVAATQTQTQTVGGSRALIRNLFLFGSVSSCFHLS